MILTELKVNVEKSGERGSKTHLGLFYGNQERCYVSLALETIKRFFLKGIRMYCL